MANTGSFGNPEFYLDFMNFDPHIKNPKIFPPQKKSIGGSGAEESKDKKQTKPNVAKKKLPKEVRIDSIHDLVKLSFTEIKNLDVKELKGDLFERILEETIYPKASPAKTQAHPTKYCPPLGKQMVASELKAPPKYIPPIDYKLPVTPAVPLSHALVTHLKLKSLEFQIHYKTDFGCEICILGSCEKLGNWTPAKA